MVEKVSVVSENASLTMNRRLVSTDVQGVSAEGSGDNEQHVVGNCRKGSPCEYGGKELGRIVSYVCMETRTCK